VQLKLADNLLVIDPLEVRIFPDTITINMETRINQYVPVSAVLYGEPRYGFSRGALTVVPSMVKISGPRSMLSAVQAIYTEGISILDKSESFSASVNLLNDNGFVRIDSLDTVDVYVQIVAKETFRTFPLQAAITNLREEFMVEGIASSVLVDVYVSGSQIDFDRITAQDFSAAIDFSTVDQEGEYTLPVTVTLPDHVFLESVTPSEVTVAVTDLF
jgi:YbbR domain-containing protein